MSLVNHNRPRIFLSYAHGDNEQGDFRWVAQELTRVGADVEYDERVLVVGQRLWPQIEQRILDPTLRGWGILLTRNSMASQSCMEELEYARLRTLTDRNWQFPLIGLVHEVPVNELPPAIRTRLYVSMRDPDWAQRVVAGLEQLAHRPPEQQLARLHWRVHASYQGDPELVAVEARPRFQPMQHFAVLTPLPGAEQVGIGAPGGAGVGGAPFDVADGTAEWRGEQCQIRAMRGPIEPGASVYAIFRGRVPRWVAVGPTAGPWTFPRGEDLETFVIEG